ncbi:hypothetical protein CN540_28325 [Bacillus toyonensis]|uniref:hypothetical protein n=1 Tax=Bacillus toyonensis TaxID=155322 RepID=UPI000BF1EE9C|nr:hypothetical protein [Bacillus toyonensis]PEN47008.1 hypothetical protein CN540_28325 [Bacillus toyonensis]
MRVTCSYDICLQKGEEKHSRFSVIKDAFGLTNQILSRKIIDDIDVSVKGITYITGYSGTGKSTLLKILSEKLENALYLAPPIQTDIPIIDSVGGDIGTAMGILNYVGLGEAYVYLTPYCHLSDGQKFRFQLAHALLKEPKFLIIDEFLSNVDRVSAKIVSFNFQKLCRKKGISAIVATTHEDLIEAVAPDQLIRLDFNGKFQIDNEAHPPKISELDSLQVCFGTISDYESLKPYHYADNMPTSEVANQYNVEAYTIKYKKNCIAIAMLQSPYPKDWNNIWYFKELNDNVMISNGTIVHPSFRGAGLTKKIYKFAHHDIFQKGIKCISAHSAMSRFFPYKRGSGYVERTHPSEIKSKTQVSLEDFLYSLNISDLTSLHSSDFCESFVQSLDSTQQKELRSLAIDTYSESLVAINVYLREVSDLNELTIDQRTELRGIFKEAISELSLSDMLQDTVYFPMRGVYLKKADYERNGGY